MAKFNRGDVLVLGLNRFVIFEVNDSEVLISHISDVLCERGKWIDKSLLPTPTAHIDLDKYQ